MQRLVKNKTQDIDKRCAVPLQPQRRPKTSPVSSMMTNLRESGRQIMQSW